MLSLFDTIRRYKTPLLYSVSSVLKALATIISGIIVAKYIFPNDLGLWTIISLALTYSLFLQAGLVNGLNLELPYAYGHSNNEYAKRMAGVVQTFTVSVSVFVLIVGIICFLCLQNNEPKIRYGILAVSIIIAFTFYQNYLLSTFRSNNSFQKLSVIQIVDACNNVFSLILVVYFAYYGMIVKAIVVIVVFVLLLHIFRPIKVGFLWNKTIFLKLLKVGILIFALSYLEATALTSDKLWLTRFSTITEVGLYAFALYALNLFITLSSSVASYIYPRMSYDYGKTGDKIRLWKKVKKITWILVLFQFPLVVIGFLLIPIVISKFFPNYLLSTTPMQILLIAGYFKGCTAGMNAMTSTRSWRHLSLNIIIYAFLLFTLTFIGIKIANNKIEGVACGILVANMIYLISGLCFTYKALLRKSRPIEQI